MVVEDFEEDNFLDGSHNSIEDLLLVIALHPIIIVFSSNVSVDTHAVLVVVHATS